MPEKLTDSAPLSAVEQENPVQLFRAELGQLAAENKAVKRNEAEQPEPKNPDDIKTQRMIWYQNIINAFSKILARQNQAENLLSPHLHHVLAEYLEELTDPDHPLENRLTNRLDNSKAQFIISIMEKRIGNVDKSVMPFEEFSKLDERWHAIHNNLFTIFSGDHDEVSNPEDWDPFTLQLHNLNPKTFYYKKFQNDHSELDSELRKLVKHKLAARGNKTLGNQIIEQMQEPLYKAYIIMKNYGATDQELFS